MRKIIYLVVVLLVASITTAEEWMTFTTDDGLAHNQCICVAVDHDGVVWVGHGDVFSGVGGVSSWDGETWTTYHSWTTDFALRSDYINDIAVDENNNKWFATGTILHSGGITCFNGEEWIGYVFDTLPEPEGSWFRELVFTPTNELWTISTNLLLNFREDTWNRYTVSDGLPSRYPMSLDSDSCGNIWFGSDVGISKYGSSHFTTYNNTDGLIYDYSTKILCYENKVYTLSEEEIPWRSTQYGLSIFNHFTFETFDFDTINYTVLLFDNSEVFYLGSPKGIFCGVIPNFYAFRHLDELDGLSDDHVLDIAIDEFNNKYIATACGISIYNEDEITWHIIDPNFSESSALEIYPNPFNSSCNIQAEEAFDLVIYDIHGKIVESKSNILSFNWFPKEQPTGVYILSIKTKNSSITRRITYLK